MPIEAGEHTDKFPRKRNHVAIVMVRTVKINNEGQPEANVISHHGNL